MSIDTDSVFDAIGTGWMLGDCSGIESVMAPDVKYHMPPIGDVDRAGLVGFIAGFRQAFPDFRVMLDETITDGDRVVWRWHCEATFTGESRGPGSAHRQAERRKRNDRRTFRQRPDRRGVASRRLADLAADPARLDLRDANQRTWKLRQPVELGAVA